MTKYRKKPIVIEAWRFAQPHQTKPEWLTSAFNSGIIWYQGGDASYLTIRTLEGDMRAQLGDWIIKGVKGELYPCKNDIFQATYESAAD